MARQKKHLDPDIIFLDSKNLPEFDVHQFEGKIERPISRLTSIIIIGFVLLVFGVYSGRVWYLQIVQGKEFKERAENNRLDHQIVFSERGIITDRRGQALAWNEINDTGTSSISFSARRYNTAAGLSHILGYLKYPAKDSSGFFYNTEYVPREGVEKLFNEKLKGYHGIKLTETDVHGSVMTESILTPPVHGETVTLSIDSRLQTVLYTIIKKTAEDYGFRGGAGVLMDIKTGELIVHVTYPEFNSDIMTNGTSAEISAELAKANNPFLDRVSSGLYAPGSIVKPFVALAALSEHTIDPAKKILSTGSISVPNPYNPSKPTIFKDWKAHGWVDMRDAIAVSSDVYFYAVGGGYADQKGLGIDMLDKYLRMFGFGEHMHTPFFKDVAGTIPTPAWKKEHFNGEAWRLGDTYTSSIGQYGTQVTPIQAVRAVSGIATKGTLIEPTIIKGDISNRQFWKNIPLADTDFIIAQEGMRQCVTHGVCAGLKDESVVIAAKSGTAEIGVLKNHVNSWMTGFYPYNNPHYAFAIVMERGPVDNLIGAGSVSQQFFQTLKKTTPEYIN